MLEAIHQLPTATLRSLAASLRTGSLSTAITRLGIEQSAGAGGGDVELALRALGQIGMTPVHMAVVITSIVTAREAIPDPTTLFDLVLSGPDLPGVPTADTGATIHMLITKAEQEILLVGYAIHNGRKLFEPLANRMAAVPSMRVTFCIDIAREYRDQTPGDELVRTFAADFRTKHWPWPQLPDIYFDPRSLACGGSQRASLHAKCVVVDRKIALVTSANFTEAAQQRNIEAGVVIRLAPMADRLSSYFEGLRVGGFLVPCALEHQS